MVLCNFAISFCSEYVIVRACDYEPKRFSMFIQPARHLDF